jgi:hypothetical protein
MVRLQGARVRDRASALRWAKVLPKQTSVLVDAAEDVIGDAGAPQTNGEMTAQAEANGLSSLHVQQFDVED